MAKFAKFNCKHCLHFSKLSIFFIRNIYNCVLILSFVVFLKKNSIKNVKVHPYPLLFSTDNLLFPFITLFAGLNINLSENDWLFCQKLNVQSLHCLALIKLQHFRKRKMHIIHHCTPNSIYVCILPQTCWESPERAVHMIRINFFYIFSSIQIKKLIFEHI